MPILANVKHEAFAHLIAKGQTAHQAYISAGYNANDGNACRLKANPKIAARVEELVQIVQEMRNHSSRGMVLTKEWVIEQLIENVMIAKAMLPRPDLANANKALNLLGLELGMYVERKEIGTPGEFDGLSIESKRDRVLSIATQLGLDRIKKDAMLHIEGAAQQPNT